jgi:hypothetical protein
MPLIALGAMLQILVRATQRLSLAMTCNVTFNLPLDLISKERVGII